MLLQQQNMLPLDPSLNTDHPHNAVTKVSFDCTIPLVGKVDPFSYAAAVVRTVEGRHGGQADVGF